VPHLSAEKSAILWRRARVFAAGFPAPDPRRLLSWPPLGVWGDCSVAASPEEGFERSCVFGPMADGADAPKQFGITKPLSLLGPVEADLQRTAELEKFLVEAGLYESAEESAKREEVLGKLDQIVKDWVKQLTSQRGYTDQMVEEANAVLFNFGSYRLGVHGPGADIDTLCVGPSYVNREEDFFIVLHEILAQTEDVTELQPVPDAHVPVM